MALGRLAEAIDEYRRAVALAPSKPIVRLALAVALDRDEQIDAVAHRARRRARLRSRAAAASLPRTTSSCPPAERALLPGAGAARARLDGRSARRAATFLARASGGSYAAHARQRLAEPSGESTRASSRSSGGIESRARRAGARARRGRRSRRACRRRAWCGSPSDDQQRGLRSRAAASSRRLPGSCLVPERCRAVLAALPDRDRDGSARRTPRRGIRSRRRLR